MKPQTSCAGFVVLIACAVAPTPVPAQNSSIYAEHGKLIRASQDVSPLGNDLMGDKVSLYNGSLEFSQTDVSLPGNNALPVAVGRKLVPDSQVFRSGHFGDWELEIPHLHGIFRYNQPWPVLTSPPYNRCSNFGAPPAASQSGGNWNPDEYWHGNFISVPGAGTQEMLKRTAANSLYPADGQAYPIVTRSLWAIRCLPTLKRGTGEGFVAVAPDGTQYQFDWLVTRQYPAATKPGPSPQFATSESSFAGDAKGSSVAAPSAKTQPPSPQVVDGYALSRDEVWIMPTLVTDRFGNTVTYTYDSADPWKLLSIQASDGRSLTLTYESSSHRVQTVSDGTRTWTYSYHVSNSYSLDRVTQPDGSYWAFAMDAITLPGDMYLGGGDCDQPGALNNAVRTGTISHPSGAVGTFQVQATEHGRSWVPRGCRGSLADGQYPAYPKTIGTYSIKSKTLSGPGVAGLTWSYNYGPPNDSWSPCNGCAETKTVGVADPRGFTTRYTFGNRYKVTEGQLLQIEEGWDGATAVRTTVNHYRDPAAGPYPNPVGTTPQLRGDSDLATRLTPEDQRSITQQSVVFTRLGSTFDIRGRPTTMARSSSLGWSRSETTVFRDDVARWILGQLESVTDSSGKVMVTNTYDPATSTLKSTSHFGRLDKSFDFYPDGTLWKISDGGNHTTVFSNYKRGLAQSAQYADGTNESGSINDIGLVMSVTDANNSTTSYSYDAMGRLAGITYPGNDSVAWAPSSFTFQQIPYSEYDLEPGHWRHVDWSGGRTKATYFDALLRPRMVATSDGSAASMVMRRFDADNRTVFESYPSAYIPSVYSAPPGTTTEIDALGRPTRSLADSELGVLSITTDFLAGFQKRVTNARGFATTTSYQVFDEPQESALTGVAAPEGLNVAINRDAFGKTLAITRSGSYAGSPVNATRSYVYDGNELLCKTVEPEIGATIQAYDPAGNVTWRATGLPFSGISSCDTGSVAAGSQTVFGYDARNRLTSTTFGDGSPSITRSYTPDGLPQTVSSDGSTWTYAYNRRGLLEHETLVFAGQSYDIGRTHDANGHTSQLTYPDGSALALAPNALGEPTRLGNLVTGINYHPNRAVAGYTLGNGIVHSLSQNVRGLPAQLQDSGVIQDGYAYDGSGNVNTITDYQDGVSSRSLGYDGLDRLVAANSPGVWGGGSYSYDPLDNLRTSVIGARSSTHYYDANNRLSVVSNAAGNTGYTYDARGNVSGRGGQGFVFDQGNRLQQANGLATYRYDGLGRRVSITGTNGVSRTQVYSQVGQLFYGVQQYAGSSTTTRYIYLGGKLVAEQASDGSTAYVHTDALGSPVARTNSITTPTSKTRYEPYGLTAAGPVPSPIGFAGHVNDVDTGLVYMQQRYYDPIAGRFASVDPVVSNAITGKSFGRYHYANNNPYRYVDGDGRDAVGFLIKLLDNGGKVFLRAVDKAEAVAARRSGQNVQTATKSDAKQIEVAARGGDPKGIRQDKGHQLKDGSTGDPHFQTEGVSGHTFWGGEAGAVLPELLEALLVPIFAVPSTLAPGTLYGPGTPYKNQEEYRKGNKEAEKERKVEEDKKPQSDEKNSNHI